LGGVPGADVTALTFERPDPGRFPCLRLAYVALALGGTAPAILSAANEVAVAAFVAGNIRFSDIPVCIESALARVDRVNISLDAVRDADRLARDVAHAFVVQRSAEATRST
jgi:1-deoxy-D-xylulose-5-phosphate reductoisomerase